MSKTNLTFVKIVSVFTLLPVLLILSEFKIAHAQPLPTTEETVEEVIRTRVNFQPPSDEVPQDSASGGSRSSLALLLPKTNGSLGLTTQAKPTFFVYILEGKISTFDFILTEKETQEIFYETTISLSGKPGVIELRLSADAPLLEIGKTYVWIVVAQQGDHLAAANGMIKRVELSSDVSRQLESAEPLDKAALSAANGIWFDTLEILAELKRSQPENEAFVKEWMELLRSVGLDEISTKPLVE